MRECGTCTKCCEGWLVSNVRGYDMHPGKPCFFLEIGIGKPSKCGDYENRPQDPCRSYSCFWLINNHIPDEFKPEKCGVILDMSKIGGFSVVRVIPAPNDPDDALLDWAFDFAKSQQKNLIWTKNNQIRWIGSKWFCDMMENSNKENILYD